MGSWSDWGLNVGLIHPSPTRGFYLRLLVLLSMFVNHSSSTHHDSMNTTFSYLKQQPNVLDV